MARGKGYYTTPALQMIPYKPKSPVAAGVARKRTLMLMAISAERRPKFPVL
jgi:hypothetical protein